jgi:hypothetical protein
MRRVSIIFFAQTTLIGLSVLSISASSAEQPKSESAPPAPLINTPAPPKDAKVNGVPPRQLEIYTFLKLLAKTERIFVAEVGSERDGFVSLKISKYIKNPAVKDIHPDLAKRAADRLAKEIAGTQKEDVLPAISEIAPLRLAVTMGFKLPAQGTTAIFFVWDRVVDSEKGEITYRADHPQNIYDIELLPQVQSGVDFPRAISERRFLREWDKNMAILTARFAADLALKKSPSGNSDKGLSVRAHKTVLSVRNDNSFLMTGILENSESREQSIYDGPAGAWGVRLRKKDAPADSGWVLRLPAKDNIVSVDATLLEMLDITDFSTVFGRKSLSKELLFEADSFPVLRTLDGDYVLNVFYSSKRDGKDILEDKTAWTGTVISPDVILKFGQSIEPAKKDSEK